ncbi:MAG: Shikimate dehydrogenase (NADP(+)) [Flavobacterium sp. SCGC AAA160-P02]|nr:MAG: Shikimate dehydrogenase (NADP(+)) [Flavobacterium sp. SCGC AAA160-P02]
MEERKKLNKVIYGLVGKDISYSFSKVFFSDKFINLGLKDHEYMNFDIEKIDDLSKIVDGFGISLKGFNVTIPYKQDIIRYIDNIDAAAKEIGAVNTVRITSKGHLKGYNTDVVGFKKSIYPLLKPHHTKALILGTGGASKAISYVFKQLGIDYLKVSRQASNKEEIFYSNITKELLNEYTIIVNSSPVGTFPNRSHKPAIPYQYITNKHLLFDLIYNPKQTAFLKEGVKNGAQIKNGFEMLELQAEESWRIWNK